MQDEELDKIINDAASQHHPAYDDEAWAKMHELLEKHLPQKKEQKKPFIFWLLFLLLGGAAVTFIMQQSGQNGTVNKTAAQQSKPSVYNSNTAEAAVTPVGTKNTVGTTTAAAQRLTAYNSSKPVQTQNTAYNAVNKKPATQSNIVALHNTDNKVTVNKKRRTTVKTAPPAVNNNETNGEVKTFASKTKTTIKAATAFEDDADLAASKPVVSADAKLEVEKETTTNTSTKEKFATEKNNAVTNTDSAAVLTAKRQSHNKKVSNNFLITAAAGVDKSFIKTVNPGKTKFTYGIGAGYSVGKHISITTGFFVSRKVYDAAPAEYKFSSGTQYPNLWMINADCMVYEIPVNFYYSFAPHKKHSWFTGAGVSTLFMKEERYNYKYKTPAGQYYNYEHTYSNQNKHLFSVITLTGGYQYNLNSRVQLLAAPYIKMPLSGIGEGAIHLKSGGILLTGVVKPFVKK